MGPTLFTQVFAASVSDRDNPAGWSGAPFLVSALMIVIATLMAWRTTGSRVPAAESA
jgi:hypothetical protein